MAERWKQRYDNFARAVELLGEAIDTNQQRSLSELEQPGLIQRFELVWELGWKTMRDFAADQGTPLDIPSPLNAIRKGMELSLITDGDAWIDAMKLRNSVAHEYNREQAEEAVRMISERFRPVFDRLRARLADERARAA